MISSATEKESSHREHCPAIVIIDRQKLVRSLLREMLLIRFEQLDVIGISGPDDFDRIRERDVRLVILRPNVGPSIHDMLSELAALNDAFTNAALAVLSENEEDTIVADAIACGYRGVLSTSSSVEIAVAAIQLMLAGGLYFPKPIAGSSAEEFGLVSSPDASGASHRERNADPLFASDINLADLGLTPRERQVLTQLCRGRPNKMIARDLSISENTAKMHVRRILTKLRVSNRTEAALVYQLRSGA